MWVTNKAAHQVRMEAGRAGVGRKTCSGRTGAEAAQDWSPHPPHPSLLFSCRSRKLQGEIRRDKKAGVWLVQVEGPWDDRLLSGFYSPEETKTGGSQDLQPKTYRVTWASRERTPFLGGAWWPSVGLMLGAPWAEHRSTSNPGKAHRRLGHPAWPWDH